MHPPYATCVPATPPGAGRGLVPSVDPHGGPWALLGPSRSPPSLTRPGPPRPSNAPVRLIPSSFCMAGPLTAGVVGPDVLARGVGPPAPRPAPAGSEERVRFRPPRWRVFNPGLEPRCPFGVSKVPLNGSPCPQSGPAAEIDSPRKSSPKHVFHPPPPPGPCPLFFGPISPPKAGAARASKKTSPLRRPSR